MLFENETGENVGKMEKWIWHQLIRRSIWLFSQFEFMHRCKWYERKTKCIA